MPADSQKIVEILELTKVYRDFWGRARVKALDGLSLDMKRGEVFGLLGPNGSGKTTTVKLILGLLFPTRGAVWVFGRSPRQVDIKKRVGYMPEESNFYEYLTAEETLDFFGRLFDLPRSERTKRVDALIDMVGLGRARRRPVGEFSKGMARRIGLAQALINDPDLLILDEPTTGLDPLGSREMKDLIRTLKKRGKTILLCSHLLADVEEVCDRVCILYGGKTRATGPVEELLRQQEITQIRTPQLPAEVLLQIKALIRQSLGSDSGVEVGAPTQRLEEFFMTVVEEARREKLATAGAEIGGPTAEFLAGEAQGEKLIEELVTANVKPEVVKETRQPQPVALHVAAEDRQMVEHLVTTGSPNAEKPETKQEVEVIGSAEGGVRHELLDDLAGGDKEKKDGSKVDKADKE